MDVPVEALEKQSEDARVESAAEGTRAHSADGGLAPGADGGLAPGADGGLVPRADGGLVPRADGERVPRADALRNRARLIAAATEAFSERGEATTLEDVAKRAGVGIGTLYRHFPTRDVLVEAVYRQEVENLSTRADELLAALPPDEALAQWMQHFVAYVTLKRGMTSALKSMIDANATLFDDTRAQMVAAVQRLLDAGAAAGVVRGDVAAVDVIRAMSGICLATDQVSWSEQTRPIVGLLLDGLRYGVGSGS